MELFKDKETGIYHVGFYTPKGTRTRTTGEKDRAKAMKVCKDAKIEELEMAARSKALQGEVVQAVIAGRKMNCLAVIDEWVPWSRTLNEPGTVRTQELVLRQWIRTIGFEKKPFMAVDVGHIDGFVNNDDPTGRANRDLRLASIRSLFKFASAKGYCVGNPSNLVRVKLNKLSHKQKEPKPRVPITEKEYRAIMNKAEGFYKWATALSYWAGLRLSDVACLEWDSILPTEIIVWTIKGESRVALPLTDPLIGSGELAMTILEMMEAQTDKTYCFPQERKTALDEKKKAKLSVYYKRLMDRAGVEGKSFHCIRHAFVTRLRKAGKSLEDVGRLVGHGSKEVTKIYDHSESAA